MEAAAHLRRPSIGTDNVGACLAYSGALISSGSGGNGSGRGPWTKMRLKPRHSSTELKNAAMEIQSAWRHHKRSHRYTDTLKSFADNKALYQRVRSDSVSGTPLNLSVAELALRTITRSKQAYAAPLEEQLAAIEHGLELANEEHDTKEVNAYNQAKAQKMLVIKPKMKRSDMVAAAKKIQFVARHALAKSRVQAIVDESFGILDATKQMFQKVEDPQPTPSGRDSPGSPGRLVTGTGAVARVMERVRLDPDERLQVVEDAVQRALAVAEQAEVEKFEDFKRQKAKGRALQAKPKHKRSELETKAKIIQYWWRHMAKKGSYKAVEDQWKERTAIFAFKQVLLIGQAVAMPMEPHVLEELEEALANAINAAAMSGGPVRNLPRMVGQQLLGTAGGDEDGGVFDEIDAAAIERLEVMLAEAMEAAEMSQPENPIAFVGEHLLAACATPRSPGRR